MIKYIYLVRHGQTFWNVEKKQPSYTEKKGWGGALTDIGKIQVLKAHTQIHNIHFELAYHSTLRRAIKSMEILKENNLKVDFIQSDTRLSENSLRFLDRITRTQWRDNNKKIRLLHRARKYNLLPKIDTAHKTPLMVLNEMSDLIDLEDLEKASKQTITKDYSLTLKKLKPFVNEIMSSYAKNILIVSHKGISRAIIYLLLKDYYPIKDLSKIIIPQGKVIKLKVSNSTGDIYYRAGDEWTEGVLLAN